jgi:hypothetical protein
MAVEDDATEPSCFERLPCSMGVTNNVLEGLPAFRSSTQGKIPCRGDDLTTSVMKR